MMMNEQMTVSTTMLPHYESPLPSLYEPQPQPPKPRLMFKMPRVVPDQKAKFESDELFRRLARETEQVRYTGYRDRPVEERRQKFQNQCRDGYTEIAFTNTGTNLQLSFTPVPGGYSPDVDFNKEPGKVSSRVLLIDDRCSRVLLIDDRCSCVLLIDDKCSCVLLIDDRCSCILLIDDRCSRVLLIDDRCSRVLLIDDRCSCVLLIDDRCSCVQLIDDRCSRVLLIDDRCSCVLLIDDRCSRVLLIDDRCSRVLLIDDSVANPGTFVVILLGVAITEITDIVATPYNHLFVYDRR
nr:uncharacterized protein LOC123774961 [Procambarus clarkii]